ncbi:TRAUB-domain-containing protein [Xylariaceae sp. FL0016]|nr:TRAUB-domain-containing protein [Xylariaceae sp. FL0016]
MAKSKSSSRFTDWEEKPVQDYDPEDDVAPDPSDASDASDASESVDENFGTEHYEKVGKSKLRRKEQPTLGKAYRGSRVSRAEVEAESDDEDGIEIESDESEGQDEAEATGSDQDSSSNYEDAREGFDDPDTADLEGDQDGQDDEEIDSDDAFGQSDAEKFSGFTFRGSKAASKKGKHARRPTAADFMASSGEDEGDEDKEENGLIDDEAEESDEESDEDEDGGRVIFDEDSDDDRGSEENDSNDEKPVRAKDAGRRMLQEMEHKGNAGSVNSLAATLQKDITKGHAVKQQRKGFDALLNIRIRLQKSLVAVNSFSTVEQSEDQSEPYEAAEAAAVKLWNAIDDFRVKTQLPESSKSGQKRKRSATSNTSSQDMWESMEAIEQRAHRRRREVFEKWSQNAKNMRTVDRSSRTFANSTDKPLTVRLDEEMADPERLLKRTRTPRSCAPVQVANKVSEDPNIYDDADFYQLLLKELVDQRSDSAGGPMQAATIRYTALKEAKRRRNVDPRASKGRKMAYNVHTKLQNFMAPEDRRSWEQNAIDRFFGTLFGQKMSLNEDAMSGEDEEMDGVESMGQDLEGIRLFKD